MRTMSIIVLCTIASSALAKRAPPPTIEPVIHQGIRYEARHDRPDKLHDAGYVVATRVSDGRVLWKAEVYRRKIDQHLERDVQDVYIESIVLAPNKDALRVTAEDSECYRVELQNHAVAKVSCKTWKS